MPTRIVEKSTFFDSVSTQRCRWMCSLCTNCTQGRYLQRGSQLVDFDIRLGLAECVALDLTDNQVNCRPPAYRPSRDVNDKFCRHHDRLSFIVSSRCPTSAISVRRRQLKVIGHSKGGDADRQHRGVSVSAAAAVVARRLITAREKLTLSPVKRFSRFLRGLPVYLQCFDAVGWAAGRASSL